jgi:Flp pilus assembly protein TadD
MVGDQDPRLTFPTPYRNVRPNVKYVGDHVCADCHPGQSETYRQHPMGRSMARIDHRGDREDYTPATHNPFEKFGFHFLVERRGAQVLHDLIRRGAEGQELYRQQRPVSYVVGSGARGRAYLVEQDGRLYQSPINWYSQARRWDLAPNASSGRQNDFFQPITRQCIFCHAGQAGPIETTLNRYHTPVFGDNPSIGCERCHGPGELHVAQQAKAGSSGAVDETIVNPRRLPPALREAVCQQCHLQGEVRVERRGRKTFDYRPGLPLEAFWSVFERAPAPDDQQLVGQVEQMTESRCYRESSGALGCISCHDPHVLPGAEQRVTHYRGRCLNCHQILENGDVASGSGRHATLTTRHSSQDNCIACHMPRINPADVAHTTITDHRIRRQPDQPARRMAPLRRPLLAEVALASFFDVGGQMPKRDLLRDLAVALVEARAPRRERQLMGQLALSLLEGSLQAAPDDERALQAKGQALRILGRRQEALVACETLLRHAPDQEVALQEAAALSDALGHHEAALAYWQQALRLNPGSADCHFGLAKFWAGQQQWRQGIEECQAALRLAPEHLEARMILVQCAIQSDDRELARREITTLLASDPPQKEALQRLFLELSTNPPPKSVK